MPVAGEPIDLSVESTIGSGSISEDTKTIVSIGVIAVGSLSVLYLFARTRAENRILSDSIQIESDQ